MKYICFLLINIDPYLISSVIFFSFISKLIVATENQDDEITITTG